MNDQGRVKILFELNRDDEGYPPADVEQLWAEPLGNNLFKVDNVPFFVKGVSWGDVVEALVDDKGEFRFRSLAMRSAQSTLRVVVFSDSPDARPLSVRVADLRGRLAGVGCSTELSHVPGLVAADIAPSELPKALEVLRAGEEAGLWEYEEAALRS